MKRGGFKRLQGRRLVGTYAEGKVLKLSKPISFLGDVDVETGRIVSPEHEKFGECVKGKVLVFPEGRGSTVGSYVIYGLKKKGNAPLALVVKKAEAIVAVGAIIADIPLMDNVEIEEIEDGDWAEVDCGKNEVRVYLS